MSQHEDNREASTCPWPALPPNAHKGDAGRVEALVGSTEMPGAAVLVARAAARAGAGLVTILCADAGLMQLLPPAVPEAIWLQVGQRKGQPDGRQPHARLAGCGMGDTARTRKLIGDLLALDDDTPLVLDADALNAVAAEPGLLARASNPLIITPHPGEAGRLLGYSIPADEAGRIKAAEELARLTASITCLKGQGTVISDGSQTLVNTTGCAAMATAGTGDVLGGILVAYLARAKASARQVNLFALAALAVENHGLCGERAAKELGADAVIASDLIDQLGSVQRALRT
ncbi:MAG: hydroxyethylthiazole kinase-like uncharacterized protein yjeF [Planctomycetota bacterium]|jgi:hydroxyethylthiazole kinase-like uncharacterized protein yjeF